MKHHKVQSSTKESTIVDVDTRSFVSRVNSKLKTVDQFKLPFHPLPSLVDLDDHHSANWNSQSLVDICDIFFLTFEIMYTGANGLRYNSCKYEKDLNEVVCDEICSACSEDLSSIFKWANGHAITDTIRKAYWLNSSFGQCNTMSEGLHETFAVIGRRLKVKDVFFNSIRLSLDTLKVRGFSLSVNLESRKRVTDQPTGSTEHHRPCESHNHVALTMINLDDGVEYIIDLAGSQFGIYGADVLRPQLVCEPLVTWRARFKHCRDDEAKFQYDNKRRLMETVARIVMDEKINFENDKCAEMLSKAKHVSKEDDEAACKAADEAMASLLLEEAVDITESTKKKSKTSKTNLK